MGRYQTKAPMGDEQRIDDAALIGEVIEQDELRRRREDGEQGGDASSDVSSDSKQEPPAYPCDQDHALQQGTAEEDHGGTSPDVAPKQDSYSKTRNRSFFRDMGFHVGPRPPLARPRENHQDTVPEAAVGGEFPRTPVALATVGGEFPQTFAGGEFPVSSFGLSPCRRWSGSDDGGVERSPATCSPDEAGATLLNVAREGALPSCSVEANHDPEGHDAGSCSGRTSARLLTPGLDGTTNPPAATPRLRDHSVPALPQSAVSPRVTSPRPPRLTNALVRDLNLERRRFCSPLRDPRMFPRAPSGSATAPARSYDQGTGASTRFGFGRRSFASSHNSRTSSPGSEQNSSTAGSCDTAFVFSANGSVLYYSSATGNGGRRSSNASVGFKTERPRFSVFKT